MNNNGLFIGDAIRLYLKKSPLKPRLDEYRIQAKWEEVMGKTISKYTDSLHLFGHRLVITTKVAPLRQELSYSRDKIKDLLNTALGEMIIEEVIIK